MMLFPSIVVVELSNLNSFLIRTSVMTLYYLKASKNDDRVCVDVPRFLRNSQQ